MRFLFILLLISTNAFSVSEPDNPIATATFSPEEIDKRIYKENTSQDANYHEISDAQSESILQDPENRVSSYFKVPKDLTPEVGFWFKIYSKYSLYQTLVYDKNHPDKIYTVLDVKDLFKKDKSAVAIEITLKNKVNAALALYRKAFDILIAKKEKKSKLPAVQQLIALWGHKKPAEWREIKRSMRTQTGQRDRIMDGIVTADPYMPAMESIFRKYNLPTDLVRIPLVESSFNMTVTSKADAVGAWQFLENSAKEYLVVNKALKIDERLSPIKSSFAAAKMFLRNYRILEDYGLAVIAYNHGARRLLKIKHKYKGENLSALLKLKTKNPLGYASRSYYCEFLALLHAEKYRDLVYSIPLNNGGDLDSISIVALQKSASIFDIASNYNISLFELKKFNPDIFDPKTRLPKGTRVVIPRKIPGSLVEHKSVKQYRKLAAENNSDYKLIDIIFIKKPSEQRH